VIVCKQGAARGDSFFIAFSLFSSLEAAGIYARGLFFFIAFFLYSRRCR